MLEKIHNEAMAMGEAKLTELRTQCEAKLDGARFEEVPKILLDYIDMVTTGKALMASLEMVKIAADHEASEDEVASAIRPGLIHDTGERAAGLA